MPLVSVWQNGALNRLEAFNSIYLEWELFGRASVPVDAVCHHSAGTFEEANNMIPES